MNSQHHDNWNRWLGAMAIVILVATVAQGKENVLDKRAEVAKQNALKQIERRLATKGGGLDQETWYVILFQDQAARAENYYTSPYTGRRLWAGNAKRANHCVKVKGRIAAADKVYQFLSQSPQALQKLPPTAYDNVVRWNKSWDFRAFRSGTEAEAHYQSLLGPAVQASSGLRK